MTREDFFDKFGKVSDATFNEWVKKGYLPGTVLLEDGTGWFVPDRAWPPYTKGRAKNADAIYTSIVKGCLLRRRPIAEIYKCSQQEFDIYISELANAGLINIVVDGGVSYYYATTKSMDYTNRSKKELAKFVQSCLATAVEAGVKGMTEAAIGCYTTGPRQV